MTQDEQRRQAAEELRRAIALGKAHATKCLEVAFESFQIMADTEDEEQANGELGANLGQTFDCIEKAFGVELTDEAVALLHFNLLTSLAQHGGMSMCVIWQWAHAIEHATQLSAQGAGVGVTVQ
jgi:hypothetical protein